MREDTRPETPLAKSSSDPPPASGAWKRPAVHAPNSADEAPFGAMQTSHARVDWATGSGKVRTFHARGPVGIAFAVLLLLAIGALIALFVVFALGIGTALALGAGVVAALGVGVSTLRRRLSSARNDRLGPPERRAP
jgi:hypothetical protein